MTREEIQAQLDNCCGPSPRPPLPQRVVTGIEREERRRLAEEAEARAMYVELGAPPEAE